MIQHQLFAAATFCLLSVIANSVAAYDFTCNLYCYHGGECRHGHGKFGSYSGVEDDEEMPWEKVKHENGMYCICPVGYTGLQCEIKMVVCGSNDHTCFNGSACKKDHSGMGESYWRCECDPKESVLTASYGTATLFLYYEISIKRSRVCLSSFSFIIIL
jgi:hypothetical protein